MPTVQAHTQLTLDEIKPLPPNEAIPALDIYISSNPRSDEAYTLRGMRHWALEHRAAAINDYLSALRINPDSPARLALQNAHDILGYFNPDLLNP